MTPGARYASVFRPGLFEGQVVIVTGGGSGLGRCTAHELAALGARVALVGRKIEKLTAVRDEIDHVGGEARCFPCDIREEETVKSTIAAILAAFGRIDGLVKDRKTHPARSRPRARCAAIRAWSGLTGERCGLS